MTVMLDIVVEQKYQKCFSMIDFGSEKLIKVMSRFTKLSSSIITRSVFSV